MNLPGLRCWALSVALVCSLHAETKSKKRGAVFDFDNAAARGGITSPYFEAGAPNLGKAAADLLVNHLVESGAVSVIERSALDKVLAEQTSPIVIAPMRKLQQKSAESSVSMPSYWAASPITITTTA